jgi:polar amino acid transport system substrate-binding protein
MAGFEVDIAHEIARDIFGDPGRVDFRYIDGGDRESALRDGDVDIVVRTMTVTRARQANVEFSTPYLRTSPRLLVPPGFRRHRSRRPRRPDRLRHPRLDQRPGGLRRRPPPPGARHPDLAGLSHGDAAGSGGRDLLRCRHPVGTAGTGPEHRTGLARRHRRHRRIRRLRGRHRPRDRPGQPPPLVRQVNSTLERLRTDGTWDRLYTRWLAPYLGPDTPPDAAYRDDRGSADLDRYRREAAATAAPSTSSAPTTEARPR